MKEPHGGKYKEEQQEAPLQKITQGFLTLLHPAEGKERLSEKAEIT